MRKYICKNCGANLDPGEHCDCLENQIKDMQMWDKLLKQHSDGQLTISDELNPIKED